MKFFLSFVCLLILNGNLTFGQSQKNPIPDTSKAIAIDTAGTALVQEKPGLIDESNVIVPRDERFNFSLVKILRGLLGMLVLILIAWLFSSNRGAINWRVVFIGLAIQMILAIGILWIPSVEIFFEFVGKFFVKILDFTYAGTEFLFKSNESGIIEKPLLNFAITILPTIIFFSALTSVLFYFGIIQFVVYGMAWALSRVLRISGAESLSVAGNIFLGQTESPFMIKAYLEKMNRSEMLLVMSGGMATLAGGVLAVYISVLGGTDPVQRLIFAKHLLAASVMAAPGVIVVSKILVPQTEEINKVMKIPREQIGKNVLLRKLRFK